MNSREYRELQEVLDIIGEGEKGPVTAAARSVLDRWQLCDECDGEGFEVEEHIRSVAEHHPSCSGGSGCESTCPIEVPVPEYERVPCTRCGGSGVLPNQTVEIDQTTLRIEARKEWTANLKLGRIVVPDQWDKAIWLDHLAARTEYIVRQLPGVKIDFELDHDAYEAAVRAFDKETE